MKVGNFVLTMLEPFLVQVRVRGGLPDHLQFRVTSESTSTVIGLGSTTSIGPTERQTHFDEIWTSGTPSGCNMFRQKEVFETEIAIAGRKM